MTLVVLKTSFGLMDMLMYGLSKLRLLKELNKIEIMIDK